MRGRRELEDAMTVTRLGAGGARMGDGRGEACNEALSEGKVDEGLVSSAHAQALQALLSA